MKFDKYGVRLVRENTFEYGQKVTGSDDIANICKEMGFGDYSEEHFGVFSLDSKGNILGYNEVAIGELNSAGVHPREVFKGVILLNAACIIMVHNHPSGDSTPSEADISTTKRFVEGGELLGIPVLDHIIIGYKGYTSLRYEGCM